MIAYETLFEDAPNGIHDNLKINMAGCPDLLHSGNGGALKRFQQILEEADKVLYTNHVLYLKMKKAINYLNFQSITYCR